MTKKLNISRRDFLNGVALSIAAGSSLSPIELLAMTSNAPAYANVNGAIDAADRAVNEQTGTV
jgi:hypothetical protein